MYGWCDGTVDAREGAVIRDKLCVCMSSGVVIDAVKWCGQE